MRAAATRAYCRLILQLRRDDALPLDTWLRESIRGELQLRFLRHGPGRQLMIGIEASGRDLRRVGQIVRGLDAHPGVRSLRWDMVRLRPAGVASRA